jgi:hypothetical protein
VIGEVTGRNLPPFCVLSKGGCSRVVGEETGRNLPPSCISSKGGSSGGVVGGETSLTILCFKQERE